MKYIGVSLYVFWILITMFKFGSLPKDRTFSYMSAIFGNITWYHNIRNLLFLVAVGICISYAPLKIIYLLIALSTILLGVTGIKNFFQRVGSPWADLSIFFCSTLCAILCSTFFVKL